MKYDNKCRQCETCDVCNGYGYLLTAEGDNLIEFLKRRSVNVPMSPRAEEKLRGMVE